MGFGLCPREVHQGGHAVGAADLGREAVLPRVAVLEEAGTRLFRSTMMRLSDLSGDRLGIILSMKELARQRERGRSRWTIVTPCQVVVVHRDPGAVGRMFGQRPHAVRGLCGQASLELHLHIYISTDLHVYISACLLTFSGEPPQYRWSP